MRYFIRYQDFINNFDLESEVLDNFLEEKNLLTELKYEFKPIEPKEYKIQNLKNILGESLGVYANELLKKGNLLVIELTENDITLFPEEKIIVLKLADNLMYQEISHEESFKKTSKSSEIQTRLLELINKK